jgi:energy-coupling factor transporter ATP-binding protein EcfA2
MLKDIRNIKIQGASFETLTQLPLLCDGNNPAKAILLYGRNGFGKSTIARAFRKIKGLPGGNIQTALVSDAQGATITLTDEERAHIFIFDECYVNENVRVQEDGLGSIVMLGEQAGLTELIENVTAELREIETDRDQKRSNLNEYNDSSSPKSPRYYINKMYAVLQQDDGWAGRKRKIEQLRRNASVSDNTFRDFITLSPKRTRDELIVDFDNEWKRLEAAQSGISKITASLPNVPSAYKSFNSDDGNYLLKKVIEHPELTEREQYLLGLVQKGQGEELKRTAREFESSELIKCPKCHQALTAQYKSDLIESIQKVLSEEVKNHQNRLNALMLSELVMDLEPFKDLSSYQVCIDQIASINNVIQSNNSMLQSKIDDPYTPIVDELSSLCEMISTLEDSLKELEEEKSTHNRAVADTRPIKTSLIRINNEIAYWDVIDLSRQLDAKKTEKELAESNFNAAQQACVEKHNYLNKLNAQRDSINIAIDVINEGLKYIFFSNNRMQISVDNGMYRLNCNGHSVKPKDVSVGERNIIGLCYFFANSLKGKSRDTAYTEEYLLIIDDPVSSFDLENRVGILSYLNLELGKFLLGNPESKVLIMTHDLFTAVDVGKMCADLVKDCKRKFNGQGSFVYSPKELRDNQVFRFNNNRNEYTTLLELVYDYANGGATDQEPYIGNIIRQVLEAFATFEFKKKIDDVSIDDEILSLMGNEKHRLYFKNLMCRLIMNEGSHRYDQTRNMQVDFFSFISEPNKRRTAKDILCFMELLNAPHIKAHLGADCVRVIDGWCEDILATD